MIRQIFAITTLFGLSVVLADDHVDRADADGDGFVSLYELRAAYFADPEFNRRIEQAFARYDRNRDGLISAQERQAVRRDLAGGGDAGDGRAADADLQDSAGASGGRPKPAGPIDTTTQADPGRSEIHGAKPGLAIDPPLTTGGGGAGRPKPGAPVAVEAGPRPAQPVGVQSRMQTWLTDMDTDNSGRVSMSELVASGDGKPWFSEREFAAADRSGDGELDAGELSLLVQSIERRQR